MKTVSVTAHFDGEHIKLDEPLNLEPNTKLMVTVLSVQDDERFLLARAFCGGLASAYSEDEEEYSVSDLKVVNPAYERR